MAVIVNIPNAHDDNSQWNASSGYWDINVRTNDGYVFAGDIKAVYNNKSGYPKSVVLQQNGAKVWAFGKLSDTTAKTEITITGNTQSENGLEVINNIPNTTATGVKTGKRSGSVNVTANEGFKITGAKVAFMNGNGYPASEDMTISEDGKTASWSNDDFSTGSRVTLTGETGNTQSENGLEVINNIPNTTATGVKTGKRSGSVNVTANEGFKITGAKVAFMNGNGYPASEDMTISEDGKTASWSNDDFSTGSRVTLTGETGKFPKGVSIDTNLSNCYADPPLPEFLQYGETLNITIKANENTTFDTEQSTPNFYYYNENGYPTKQDLTVSEDKRTATGSIVLQNGWYNLSVNAQAYPVAVVGEQYGAINVYLVTLDELAEFSGKRFFKETGTDPVTGAPIYENMDLGAYVNKIRRVYTNMGASSTDVIRCGNYNTGVSCHQPAQDKITLDFGTAVVPAHNEDNTDYESEIQIFLPFAGFVTLNTDYAGKTIGLQYVINVVTGNGVALLSCNDVVFQVEETEPSSEIIYLSPSTQVKTVGGDDWNEMLYYGLEPYIYCKWYESASNGRNNDRQTGILGDFRGFNVFDDVTPIHTAEMLTEEQEMIYKALSDGVYIE